MASETESRFSWLRKTFSGLSSTSVLTIVFLVLAAMTGAYIWGVITGREMDAPATEPAREEPPAPVAELAPDRILQAHELEFTQALRDETRRPGSENAPLPAPEPRKEEIPAPPAPPAPENPVSQADIETDADSIYDYVFQVAALRDAGAADNLRQSLEGEGLRTRLEQNGKLYIILVLMRGRAARVEELAGITRQLRLGEPLLKSRKQVSQAEQARPQPIQKNRDNQ